MDVHPIALYSFSLIDISKLPRFLGAGVGAGAVMGIFNTQRNN
jgi:hypothetical protein